MKRAGILLPGVFRNTINIHNIYENIIIPNPDYAFDIFICCWNIGTDIYTYASCEEILQNKHYIVDISDLQHVFNPVEVKIINLVDFQMMIRDKTDILKRHREYPSLDLVAHNIICQIYAIEQSINMIHTYEINNQITYDLIIRHRFDLFLKSPIIFNNYNISSIHGIKNANCFPPDWFFFGNNNSMKDFLKIFTKLENKDINLDVPEKMFIRSSNNNIIFDIPDIFYINKR